MKNLLVATLFIVINMLLNFNMLMAQKAAMTNSGMVKALADTTLISAYEMTLQPGQTTDVHTHPAHFFYALTDGTLKVTFTDGEIQTYALKAGDSGYSMPERPHRTQNTGKKAIRFIVIELKEHPYTDRRMN